MEKEKTMKVRAIKKGYYEGRIIKIGEVFECKDKQLPSWVEQIKKEKKQEDKKQSECRSCGNDEFAQRGTPLFETKTPDGNGEKQNDGQNPEQVNKPDEQKAPEDEQNQGEDEQNAPEDEQSADNILNEVEKAQYLELLLNEAVEKNILIEDADKKSVDEQIAELEAKLDKRKPE